MAEQVAATALQIRGLAKSFGPTRALDGVDVTVARGTVHALLGGNGSGKSTLVKILAGTYQADGGDIELGGEQLSAPSYRAADGHRHGLRFVHQDLGLIESASIAENMAFTQGFPTRRGGRVAWHQLRDSTAELLRVYDIRASPQAPVGMLRPSDRTMVAIARALGLQSPDRGLLILDEPTAALGRQESEALLLAVRRRAAAGQTVLLISHHLDEVMQVADTITVLRDGRTAGVLDRSEATEERIVTLIAGHRVARSGAAVAAPTGRPALEITGLAAGPLTGVDLTVHAGEVVGLIGLSGSGRTSLMHAVFGDKSPRAGQVSVEGHVLRRGVPGAMAAGVALVPEDRARDAAFPDHSVSDNVSAAVLTRYWRGGVMRRGQQERESVGLCSDYDVRTAGPGAPLSTLSGGNQQKALVARWLRRKPKVLLLDEPTQGVDIVSRDQIHQQVRQAAAQGCAVVVSSSDSQEIASLCDRAVLLANGGVAGRVECSDLTPDNIDRLIQSSYVPRSAGVPA